MLAKFVLLLLACGICEIYAFNTTVAQLSHTKTCSCGLPNGGAIVQRLTRKFFFVDGLFYDKYANSVDFVDRHGWSINSYCLVTGVTTTMLIKEFKGQEVAAIFPAKWRLHQYVVAANQTLHLLHITYDKDKKAIGYTLKEIMKVTDENYLFAKGTTTLGGCIVIGLKPADYKDDDYKHGRGQFVKVNVTSKKVEVIDSGYDLPGGVAFNRHYTKAYFGDVETSKIYCFKYNASTGKFSDKKLIFDITNYEYIVKGNITAITVDREGHLWIGMLRSYQIIVFDPEIKTIVRKIGISSSVVNSFAWGGKNGGILLAGTEMMFPVKDPRCEPDSGRMLGISGTGNRGCHQKKVRINHDE